MGDESVSGAAVEDAEAPSAAPVVGPVPLEVARERRQAKIAAFRAQAGKAAEGGEAPVVESTAAPEKAEPTLTKPPAVKLAEPKPQTGGEKDDATERGIAAIEKRDARQREMLKADRAKHDAEIAEERRQIAEARAALENKSTSFDDLRKLPPARRAIEAMKAAGIDPEDEEVMELVARDAYARSKSGKADPKNRAYADQIAEKSGIASELADLRKELEGVRTELTTRDKRAEIERFQQSYLDDAVKAIPKESSFIGIAHAANPKAARSALLALGQRMEAEAIEENGGRFDSTLTPSHAEVIARYERDKRQAYKDDGLTDAQIAALLKPTTAAQPTERRPPATLDVTVKSTTPALNGTGVPTRAQKIEAARAGRIKRNVEQLS